MRYHLKLAHGGCSSVGRASGCDPEFRDRAPSLTRNSGIILSMNFRNSKQQGDYGVLQAINYYMGKGYDVSLPFGDNLRYDLIVDKEGTLYRVQCKTSVTKNRHGTGFEVRLCTSGGNQSWNKVMKTISATEVDLVFAWCADGSIWEIPASDVENKKTFSATSFNHKYHVGGPLQRDHVQLEKRQKVYLCECGETKSKSAISCMLCSRKRSTKIEWPSYSQLLEMVQKQGFSKTGRDLGVSDKAVKKRLSNHKE